MHTPETSYPPADPHVMQCMEVWGGNEPVEQAVTLLGLDAWIYSRPYLAASGGGDVYYASSCATGRIVRLLLADVSGHGAAVCDIAGQLRRLMRSHVNHPSQLSFVREINRRFSSLSQDGCFATAIITTFISTRNQLTLCNAGHPTPLLYRARTRAWSLLKPMAAADRGGDVPEKGLTNLPLGIEDASDYEQFTVKLEKDDVVLCFSDSLTEAKEGSGEMLGESGLLAVVRRTEVAPAEGFIERLLRNISACNAGNLEEDDVSVLMFRANSNGRWVPISRKLLAPFRFLASCAMAIRRGEPLGLPSW